jgi:hypothetical protein
MVSMPRGNGKTGLASVLALYGLFADEVEGAQVLTVASDERRARHVFNACRRIIELDERLAERVQVFQDRIYVPHTDSTLAPLPAEPAALQGRDPTLAVVDELHVVGEATWKAMAWGKRDRSLTLAISTPAANTESVMWRLVTPLQAGGVRSPRRLRGRRRRRLGGSQSRARRLPSRRRAASYAATTREPSFRRFRLGQWVGQVDRWLPSGSWDASPSVSQCRTRANLAIQHSAPESPSSSHSSAPRGIRPGAPLRIIF